VLPVDEYNRPRVPARIDTPYLPAFFVRAQVMGEPALRVIATELVKSIKSNVSVDWMHREAARARIRVPVKRLLRKYGYPPDLQDAAVQKVLQQAEALSAAWAA
jgi:type I restriction enzyme, R subunit